MLEDCSASFGQPYPKISLIANCSNVSLTRCGFYGVESASNTPALTGLAVTNSTVFLQDCSVSGGSGKYAFPSALPPAPALVVNGGRIHISGGMVIGGNGASIANDGSCINGGDGAPAVLLGVGSPFLTTLGNPLVGGSGGTVVSCGQAGVAGPLVQIESGLFTPFQDQARSLKLASPARVGQFTTLTVSGVPGEAAFALVSPSVQAQFILALKGALIPAFPLTLVPLGTIPVGGTLTYPITIPSDLLPPGLEALNVHAQIHVAGALGSGIVGSSSVLTVVDSSF